MNQYDFTLKFRLNDPEESAEKYLRALAENGCDDALVGIGKLGRVSLNFTREASSVPGAITSAIKDVRKSIPGALSVEATPDFVGSLISLIYTARQGNTFEKSYSTRPTLSPSRYMKEIHRCGIWRMYCVGLQPMIREGWTVNYSRYRN